MRTALFTLSHLQGLDRFGGSYFDRYPKWLNFQSEIQSELGFHEIVLADNASAYPDLLRLMRPFGGAAFYDHEEFNAGSMELDGEEVLHVIRFRERLGPTGAPFGYPYIWRAHWLLSSLMGHFEKFIILDSDDYIVSRRLAHHIRGIRSGFEVFWEPRYGFPEAGCMVLCADAFPRWLEYAKTPWREKVGKLFETDLPYTRINKDFVCGRFGERREPQAFGMDLYCECPPDMDLEYHLGDKQCLF